MMDLEDKIIYLDNAATTKISDEVLKTYVETSKEYYANPASIHSEGNKSMRLLNKAREQLLRHFHCDKHDLIFTSGASEANNLAIKGYCYKHVNRGNRIITTAIEHPSVIETFEQLKLFGFDVIYLPINEQGTINLKDLKSAINEHTILVSVMAVNNEIGSINNIDEIAKLIKNYPKIVLHVDCTQAVGKINLNYQDIDMFSYSGHKLHAPHYIGALIKKKNIELLPLINGGGQEDGYRSGTNDVALAVSLTKATRLALSNIEEKKEKINALSQAIYQYLDTNKDLYHVNSNRDNPYIVNFSLLTKKASVVVEALSNNKIMVSSTSACHSRREKGSYVVYELTHDDNLSHNTIRVSLCEDNNLDEINYFINTLDKVVKGIR